MTPVMEALASFGCYASAGISSAKTAVISGFSYISNTAINVLKSIQTTGKSAYAFTATKYAENPKVLNTALAVLGAGALYAGRAHLAAIPVAISKLCNKS